MVQMEIPDDKPVLIYTSYRTGSTALCDELATQLGYKNFDEAYHPHERFQDRYREFAGYKQSNTNYILKLMPDQITENNKEDVKAVFDGAYKIRLYRHDFVKQIASWYVSMITDFWHQTADEQMSTDAVRLDKDFMLECCHRILWNNQQIEKMPATSFDADLQFEGMELSNSQYQPRNQPDNYAEVIQLAEATLLDSGLAEKKDA